MNALPRTLALGGPDGAGKSTQADRLLKRLSAAGHDALLCTVWDLLDGEAAGAIPFSSKGEIDAFLAGLHAQGRALFLHMALREALDRALAAQGERILVIVGYWPKYNAVERAYGGDPALLDALAAAFPPTALPLWLDLAPDAALARKQAVSGYETAGQGRAGFIPFQTRVHAQLETLLARDPAWRRIDAKGTPDDVEAAIDAHVMPWLNTL